MSLRSSETTKAAGLAVAMIINNVVALGSTFVFARIINDYGSLAALVSYLLILAVVGQAMQVATAREGVLGHLGVGRGMLATLASWTKSMVVVTAVMTVVVVPPPRAAETYAPPNRAAADMPGGTAKKKHQPTTAAARSPNARRAYVETPPASGWRAPRRVPSLCSASATASPAAVGRIAATK